MRTVSWWAVFVGKRYLLIKGFGYSVPSKCFKPKANKLKEGGKKKKKKINSLLGGRADCHLDDPLHNTVISPKSAS